MDVSFGVTAQVFHIGPASCGVYGAPAGVCEAVRQVGDDAAGASWRRRRLSAAREGVALNAGQAYVAEILTDLLCSTPECAALWAPRGRGSCARVRCCATPSSRTRSCCWRAKVRSRSIAGEVARAVCDWLRARGGSLTPEDLAGYRAVERKPIRIAYRDCEVLTNPPPSAGGTLLAYCARAARPGPRRRRCAECVDAMAAAQSERTPEFLEGLAEEGFLERFLARAPGLDDAHLGARRRRAARAA